MDVQQSIVAALKSFPFVKRVILFGSRARSDHQPKSDYDIAVDCPDASLDEWLDILEAISRIPTLLSIQLVCLNTSSEDLQEEVKKDGIVIYEQKN